MRVKYSDLWKNRYRYMKLKTKVKLSACIIKIILLSDESLKKCNVNSFLFRAVQPQRNCITVLTMRNWECERKFALEYLQFVKKSNNLFHEFDWPSYSKHDLSGLYWCKYVYNFIKSWPCKFCVILQQIFKMCHSSLWWSTKQQMPPMLSKLSSLMGLWEVWSCWRVS